MNRMLGVLEKRLAAVPLSPTTLLLVLLLAITAPIHWGCGGGTSAEGDGTDSTAVAEADTTGNEDEEDDSGKNTRERTTTVNASKVVRGDLVVPVVAEGAIRARNSTEILAEISGRVERIQVEEGQTVRKGQVIARLDDREYRVALEEARSKYLEAVGRLAADEESLESAKATDWFKEQMEELDRLEAARTITHDERDERALTLEVEAAKQGAFRGDLVKVRSGLAAARADKARAELDLEHTEIRAPFSGVVSKLTLTSGERVAVNQKICDLVDNLNLEAEVAVLESDLAGLETGRSALLEIPALGDTLRVHVDVMSPRIDPESRTCSVLLRFQNEDGHIRPGMFVRASIAGRIYPERLLVPREAILIRDGRPLLFKVVDDRAEWVYVQTGLANDQVVSIDKVLQGGPLDPGTPVVISDHLTLTHQAKVKIRKMQKVTFALTAQQDQ